MNESDFLQRMRKRQSPGIHHQPPHPGRFPHPVRTLPSDWVAEFGHRLTAVGGHIYHVNNPETARLQLRDIITHLREKGLRLQQAVITAHPILQDLELDTLLPRLEIKPFTMGQSSFNIQHADLGLTGVEYAIASSGTIVMAASPQHPRSASLLPPVHIAVVKQSQLLPDLAALADKLHEDFPERPSSGLALITGPSRTADIEQTLSIGVHGPGELHVLFTGD